MPSKIRKVFIANRGDVAIRVASTCRELGIGAATAHVKGEEEALHVKAGTETHLLPGEGTRAYLDIDAIVQVAKRSGADAVHPGWGFLAENAAFARACENAGLIFIGPTPEQIEAMGDKAAAKKIAVEAGVSTLPFASEGQKKDEAKFLRDAKAVGFPLLLKPLAGGGGKGMVPVAKEADLKEGVLRGRREAQSAFGDDRLLAEPYLAEPRHVEIQVAGDGKGGAISLGERDCTLQRRHQKILEESPSPHLSEKLRAALCKAAEAIVKKVKYRNLGTVEFLVDGKGRHFFMEMNTRLQVEHPVTEARFDLDLVAAQLRLAEGESLSKVFGAPKASGHVIEVRVYSEVPHENFMPSTGKILAFQACDSNLARVDTGIAQGMNVDHSFDPLLLKVIVKEKTRDAALKAMDRALAATTILGVETNLNFLRWICQSKDVRSGKYDTGWVAKNLDAYRAWEKALPAGDAALSAFVADLERRKRKTVSGEDDEPWTGNPWVTLGSWRMLGGDA